MSAQTPTTKRLAEILRAQARQIAKAPDKRPEDFEDAAVVWALRTAANSVRKPQKVPGCRSGR